jgi:hypothetical protein
MICNKTIANNIQTLILAAILQLLTGSFSSRATTAMRVMLCAAVGVSSKL